VPELERNTVSYINSVLKDIENSSMQYAAMISTGINPLDYKRFRETLPVINFTFSSDIQKPQSREMRIQVVYQNKELNKDTALWAHDFTVNSIVAWQILGFSPGIELIEDLKEKAGVFIRWDSDKITLS
jgi:hypothetical protein